MYSASSSCYGIPEITPTPEISDISPQYPYALTKYLGEQIVMHWSHVYKVPAISLRFFNVYGPRSRTSGTYGAVFGVFLAQKLAKQPFTVVGDGKQTRDFVYVEDVAEAFLKASKTKFKNEILNIGSDNTHSINYLTDLIVGDKIYIAKRPGEPDCTFADIKKAKKILNWKPKTSLKEGVTNMLSDLSYWKDAPLWNKRKIDKATKSWFKYLKK